MLPEEEVNTSYWKEFRKAGGCKCCCCCFCKGCYPEHRAIVKGIFTRRPSSLEPLDGIRAVASLWVISLHTGEEDGYPVHEICNLDHWSWI